MAQIEYIKHLDESEGKSLRKIAHELGMNFRTVEKYAYMNNFSPQVLLMWNRKTTPSLVHIFQR